MAENLFKVGNIISTVSSLVQTSTLANQSLNREESEHHKEIDQVKQTHDKELLLLKKTHLLKQFTDVERHFQQLNSDLLSTNRECERDMYDQRNQYCQSSIIASSIMLSALVSVVVEGVLPVSQNDNMKGIYVIYAIALTLSLAFLFVCLIIYLIVIKKSSEYMSKKSISYNEKVKDALQNSSKNFSMDDFMGAFKRKQSLDEGVMDNNQASNLVQSHKPSNLIKIDEANEEWLKHEKEIEGKLTFRNLMNEKIQGELLDDNKAFDKFWTDECRDLEKAGLYCFYLGTLLFLIATAIYMYVIFQKTYFSQVGVILSLVPIGLSVCSGGYIIYYFDALSRSFELKWSDAPQGAGEIV